MNTQQRTQFVADLTRACEYANNIIAESDGYPRMHTAHEMRTLLVNAYLAGQRAAAPPDAKESQ